MISTPFVLQIFRPEIEHEITILHTQAENAYLAGARNSQLQHQIKRDQDQVNHLTAAAGGRGPLPQSPQLQSTLDQLRQAEAAEKKDRKQWQCQLYGPCRPAGNGPLARADQQRYDNDAAQVKQLASTADVEQKQLSLNIATAQAKNKAEAETQLPAAQKALQAAQKEQAQELGTFTTRNASNGGLLIRLQALDAVTSHDATLNAARWLLFLLFVVIDCMPVMIKVMLNLGPENNYDRLLKVEEQRQLCVGASNTALRQATEMMAAVTVMGERQSRLEGWTAPIPRAGPEDHVTCRRTPIISLTYWYTESDREKGVIIRTLIRRFEQKYRGIHIRAASMNFFDTRAAFTAAVQRGHAPDVLRSDLSWTQLFASEGYLLNIDSYAYQSDLNLSDYRRLSPPFGPDLRPDGTKFSPLTYAEYNGHLYGLPQVTDVLALMYNKKELAEAGITGPPRNMAQFEADAVRVVQQKKAAYGFETDGTFNKALPFLYACGGGLLDQHKNNILVNDKGSVSGLNLLLHMRNEKVKPIEVNLANGKRISPIVADFKRGTTAMIFDGPYDVSEILTGSSFSHDHGNLGIAGIPRGPAGQTGSPLGGQSYVISSSTPYPAEAYKFIKFMSSENSQISVARANHTLPTLGSATRRLVPTNSFIRQFHRIWATEAVARPAIPKAAYLFDVADPSIRAAFTRNQSANQALNTIANSWNQLGAGNEIPQSALTPGTSQTTCS